VWKPLRLRLAPLLLFGACATAGGVSPPVGAPDLLVEEQIRDNGYSSAYDVIAALRPNWLRTRGVDSFTNPGEILVYVDNTRFGGINTLVQIPTVSVYYIQWYDGISAAARWGLGHGNGVIYISTTPPR
jgi:hypothetical protein